MKKNTSLEIEGLVALDETEMKGQNGGFNWGMALNIASFAVGLCGLFQCLPSQSSGGSEYYA
jgi:hypothetical protein